MDIWLTDCSPLLITVRSGLVTGWIWLTMQTAMAIGMTMYARMPGAGGIGWLTHSIATCPFDQFTIEQLAGDLLPDGSLDQKVATGFLRNTLTNTEGGVKKEEFRVEQIIGRTKIEGPSNMAG